MAVRIELCALCDHWVLIFLRHLTSLSLERLSVTKDNSSIHQVGDQKTYEKSQYPSFLTP